LSCSYIDSVAANQYNCNFFDKILASIAKKGSLCCLALGAKLFSRQAAISANDLSKAAHNAQPLAAGFLYIDLIITNPVDLIITNSESINASPDEIPETPSSPNTRRATVENGKADFPYPNQHHYG
jgi:hypothetical protein